MGDFVHCNFIPFSSDFKMPKLVKDAGFVHVNRDNSDRRITEHTNTNMFLRISDKLVVQTVIKNTVDKVIPLQFIVKL